MSDETNAPQRATTKPVPRPFAQMDDLDTAEYVADLEAENASLRDKIGRQVDNVRVAARYAHDRMVTELRRLQEFVSELEEGDETPSR